MVRFFLTLMSAQINNELSRGCNLSFTGFYANKTEQPLPAFSMAHGPELPQTGTWGLESCGQDTPDAAGTHLGGTSHRTAISTCEERLFAVTRMKIPSAA